MSTAVEDIQDTTGPQEPLYRLAGVHRYYRVGSAEVKAVDHVDLALYPGELVAIEGPSGSGKSTILQLLGALDRPTGGSVLLNTRNLATLSDSELTGIRAKEIGFVFQSFNLIPTLTAAENVAAAMVPVLRGKAARQARAAMLLDQVGLAARARHLPSLLSGGEQQRVAIARAMANHPRVILADEPTGNLDTTSAEEIGSILRSLAADQGVTVIVVTHSENVAGWASRRLRMRDGKLFEGGAAAVPPEPEAPEPEAPEPEAPEPEAPAPASPTPVPAAMAARITAVNILLYSPAAEAARAQLRDLLHWPTQETPDRWLTFSLPPAELGVHTAEAARHEVALACDDLAAALVDLRVRGVVVDPEPRDVGFGQGVTLHLPGGLEVLLYQPSP